MEGVIYGLAPAMPKKKEFWIIIKSQNLWDTSDQWCWNVHQVLRRYHIAEKRETTVSMGAGSSPAGNRGTQCICSDSRSDQSGLPHRIRFSMHCVRDAKKETGTLLWRQAFDLNAAAVDFCLQYPDWRRPYISSGTL